MTLEANPNLFANSSLTEDNEKPELNEIALQFTTKAGNKVTTEYVGVVNRTEELKLVLADKEVTSENAKDDKCHFATNLAAAEEQKAKIGVDNKLLLTTIIWYKMLFMMMRFLSKVLI